MLPTIIDERLKAYATKTLEEEEHALKGILQEIAIYGLANTNFFEKAMFHGGTALRILYGLPRFSEDLNFLLKHPDVHFKWELYMDAIVETCKQFGLYPEITDKSRANTAVKKMFLKNDSIGKIIDLTFAHNPRRKLTIKFEIDTNPPVGSQSDLKFLEFPLDYSIMAQDLSSGFAGKCHALLCRTYIKGRDWYDFSWYVSKRISPNLTFFGHTIDQQGPWANQKIIVTPAWFLEVMQQKIKTVDWKKVVGDVEQFLNSSDKQSLKLWGIDFFMDKLNKLGNNIIA